LSDAAPSGRDPAIALIEFSSIAGGIVAGDAMVKASPIGSIYAGTVHPGKYLVLVSGDTASVEEALTVGREVGGATVLDTVFLPDIHPSVTDAVVSGDDGAMARHDALGIVETASVATILDAADAGVKAANVELAGIRLADGLGGKGYCLFSGVVAEVEAAVEAAVDRATPSGGLLHDRVIPQLHDAMRENLASDVRFRRRVVLRVAERVT
jgi:microcompartment protein CcmL/EutN